MTLFLAAPATRGSAASTDGVHRALTYAHPTSGGPDDRGPGTTTGDHR